MIPIVSADDIVDIKPKGRQIDLSVLMVFSLPKGLLVAHRVLLPFKRILEGEQSDLFYYRENDNLHVTLDCACGILEVLECANNAHAAVRVHRGRDSEQFHVVEKETNGESAFEFYLVLGLTESGDYAIGDSKQAKRLYDTVATKYLPFLVW